MYCTCTCMYIRTCMYQQEFTHIALSIHVTTVSFKTLQSNRQTGKQAGGMYMYMYIYMIVYIMYVHVHAC